MSASTPLSRFTPSVMPHELLERLFVAREGILDAIMRRVAAASSRRERNHTLLVGPRGAGKTHIVALAYHRTQAIISDGKQLQVAWLPEDPWTLVSYRHVLSAIAARMEPPHDGPVPTDEEELEHLLARRAEEQGPIVAFVENLDQILDNLGDVGQQKLRHLLQSDRSLLVVATTTRLDRSLSDQASPFYSFFTTTRLEPFDIDEASEMLTRIARERGDEALVTYLQTPEGQARLRTITHLAGGQPRMWAALAAALTMDGLEELVDLLLTRFDDLTPYYQEQLGRLSPHQRLVVAELAATDRPINVRELAERLDIDQRSLGKTMTDLADRGWIAPTTSPVTHLLDQRRTYYELAEPLARLSFQIKESRGEPLRLVVDFLKMWFAPDDLATTTEAVASQYVAQAVIAQGQDPVVCVTRLLQSLPAASAPSAPLMGEVDDALAALGNGDPEPFLRLPSALRVALEDQLDDGPNQDALFAARCRLHLHTHQEIGRWPQPTTTTWIARAEDLVTTAPDPVAVGLAQLILAGWLGRAWRLVEACTVVDAAAHTMPESARIVICETLRDVGLSALNAGDHQVALMAFQRVVADKTKLLGSDHPQTLSAKAGLAAAHWEAGHRDIAIPMQEEIVRARAEDLGPAHLSTLTARSNLASSYHGVGRLQEAIALAESVVADRLHLLGPSHPDTLNAQANLAASYGQSGRQDEAMHLLRTVIEGRRQALGPDHPDTLLVQAHLAFNHYPDLGTAVPLIESAAAALEEEFGRAHPRTLEARHNLAIAHAAADRHDDAATELASVLADSEEALGPLHPDTIRAREDLAEVLRRAGRHEEARHLGSDVSSP